MSLGNLHDPAGLVCVLTCDVSCVVCVCVCVSCVCVRVRVRVRVCALRLGYSK